MLESATPSPAETEPIGITKPAKGRPEHRSKEVFERRRWGDQIGGSIGLLVGSLLLLASMFTAWWTLSITDGGSAETISFFPGASYVTTGSPETGLFFGAPTYSASGLNQLGVLYGHILSAGIFVIVIAFVAALIGFLSLRSVRPRIYRAIILVAGCCTTAVAVMVPFLVAGFHEYAFASDVDGEITCSPPPSPCSTFWGSETTNGTTWTWGPGLGWVLAVVAAFVLVTALVFLVSAYRPYPYSDEPP